jgi:hypothetical protein
MRCRATCGRRSSRIPAVRRPTFRKSPLA